MSYQCAVARWLAIIRVIWGSPGIGNSRYTPSSRAPSVHASHDGTDRSTGGVDWLIDRTDAGRAMPHPAPIGFYFAKLWYFERLYPLVFAAAALGRARRVLPGDVDATMG